MLALWPTRKGPQPVICSQPLNQFGRAVPGKQELPARRFIDSHGLSADMLFVLFQPLRTGETFPYHNTFSLSFCLSRTGQVTVTASSPACPPTRRDAKSYTW